MFNDKTYQGGFYMTHVKFTLNNKSTQRIIEHSVKYDVSINRSTTVVNRLMENQRSECIQAEDYEQSEGQRNTIKSVTLRLTFLQFNDKYPEHVTISVLRRFLYISNKMKWHCSVQCLNTFFSLFNT